MFKILIVGLLFASSSAFAAVQVDVVGGLSYANQADTASTVYTNYKPTPKSYMAYGLLANFKSASKGNGFGLSLGGLYVQAGAHQEFSYTGLSFSQDIKMPYIQVPIAVNYWFGKAFSLGLGGYYGWGYGSMESAGYAMVGGVPVSVSSTKAFGENGYKSQDYGYLAQAQLKFDIGKKMDFILIGIYEKSVVNIFSNPGTSIYNNIILAMAGLGYTF